MSPQLAALMPDLKKGTRAAIATVVPFFLSRHFERPELAWIALGGWFASLADPGGTVRSRADAMAVFLPVAALAIAIGESVSASPIGSMVWIGAVTWLASFVRAFGSVAGNLGTVVAVVATIGTAAHTPVVIASLLFAIGVVWAALMSTLVWPSQPNLPLRHAVARVYDALAAHVEAIRVEVASGHARRERWAALIRVRHRSVRGALESARDVMVELRARHSGVSAIGANLRALLGEAELQFFWLIAYADELEHEGSTSGDADATLDELATSYRTVRDQLFTGRARPVCSRRAVATESQLAAHLIDAAYSAVELSRDLGASPTSATAELEREAAPEKRLAATATMLSSHSAAFRHACRVSAATIVATLVGRLVSPEHWQWVTITAIGVLQPYLGPTFARVAERVVGTILGAAIALAVIALFESPIAITVAMFPLVVLAVVTKPRSYRLFVLFLTPVFVLVADRWHPDLGTALDRILDVALGGAIAVIASIVIPSWERQRLPEATATALDAVARHVRVAFETFAGGGDRGRLREARREVGIALEGAEISLERMLAEPRAFRRGADESVLALTYARRLSSALTAFDESRVLRGARSLPSADDVRDYLLAAIAAAKRFVTTGVPTELHEPSGYDPAFARFVHQADLLAARHDQSIAPRLTAMT